VNLVLLVNETGGDPFVEKNIFLASGLGIASIPLGFFFLSSGRQRLLRPV
jgi:hypothetical protein